MLPYWSRAVIVSLKATPTVCVPGLANSKDATGPETTERRVVPSTPVGLSVAVNVTT